MPAKRLVVDTFNAPPPEALPDTLPAIYQWLSERGWKLSYTSDTRLNVARAMKVSLSRRKWRGRYIGDYTLSLVTPSLSHEAVIAACTRLAGVAQALSEVFSESFPQHHVSLDGCIYEDAGFCDAFEKSQGEDTLWFDFLHSRLRAPEPDDGVYFRHGFVHFSSRGKSAIIGKPQLDVIHAHLDTQEA